jgi:hypothetical protein
MTAAKLPSSPPDASGFTDTVLDPLYDKRVKGRNIDAIPVAGLLKVVGHGEKDGKRRVEFEFLRLEPVLNGYADDVAHIVEASYASRTTPDQPPLMSEQDEIDTLLADIDTWAAEREFDFDTLNDRWLTHFGEGVPESFRLGTASQLREYAQVLGVIEDPIAVKAELALDQGDDGEDDDDRDVPPATFSDSGEQT